MACLSHSVWVVDEMDGLEDFLFEAILKHIPGVGEVEVFLTGDEDVAALRLGDFRAMPHGERFCSLKGLNHKS